MKTRHLIYFIPAFFFAAACTQTVEEEEKYGAIAGIVYDNNVGDPISVAQVKLSPGGNSTVTGTDGSFSFTNIEAGNYTVSVTKKGYSDGANNVSVVAGRRAECNILLTRIPAFVTADKDELDFGENQTLTTLSFNIVNSSYENLSWHIDYDKSSTSFIVEVSPEKGTTQYGKTAAIVVKINREKLNSGKNESTIVVVSDNGDGSSEVKVRAIGQEKAKASLNINSVTDITSSTAIVHGEITFVGAPAYTERGFVYSTKENPTIDVNIEKVTVSVTEDAQFSYMLKNLDLGVKYYVRAFAINVLGVAYSSNQESFTTVASLPVVSVSAPDHIDASKKTATLHGSVDSVGDPAYSEKGFVYCEGRKTPTIDDKYVKVSGTGIGSFDTSISELKLGSTYCVRSFARNEGGISYSERTVEFTLNGTPPVVSVGETTDINLAGLSAILHGNLESIGSPAATEKGFVYSFVNKTPTENDILIKVAGVNPGSYYTSISQLELGKTYYVRAYAKNEAGIVFSSGTTSFSTNPNAPSVTMRSVSNIDLGNKTAVFHGSVDTVGDPAFTEKGFVYSSTNNEPTLSDLSIKVSGNTIGTYETKATNLDLGKTYYVRAYATNAAGTSYSSTALKFSTVATSASATMNAVTNVNRENLTALFQGSIDTAGNPAFTEKGFVYSTTNRTPTLSDLSIKVAGNGTGAYEVTAHNLVLGKTYYVRAYVINAAGTSYSTNVVEFSTAATPVVLTMKSVSNVNRENLTALFQGSVDSAGDPSFTEKGFVYSTTNSNPTLSDLSVKVAGNGTGNYESTVNDLVLGKKYYVRAYAINPAGTSYSSNVIEFSTEATSAMVTMKAVTNVSRENSTALFQGSVDSAGDPVYTEKGFVYSTTNNAPTTNDTRLKVSGSGLGYYEATATGLTLAKYYVRAYIINKAGTSYSKDVVSFELSGTTPSVSVNAASDISLASLSAVLNGYVSEIGFPAISERGFVYSYNNSSPNTNDSKATASGTAVGGSYSVRIGNLVLDKTYYVKAYVKNSSGYYYSDNTISFLTTSTLPTLSISQPTDLNTIAQTASVSGRIENAGNPPYNEKGFVYSYMNETPTVDNDKKIIVSGTQAGSFSGILTDLVLGKKYHVRAFAKSAKGVAYSSVVSFDFDESYAVVRTEKVTNLNVNNKTAVLHGAIDDIGNPAYTERGFVLSSDSDQPTIYDNKVQVSGTGIGSYEYQISGFSTEKITYVRAYAVNHKGASYGETVVLFDPDFIDYGEYIQLKSLGIAVQKTDVGKGDQHTISNMCTSSNNSGFSNWRLPSIGELISLYNLHERIGGFKRELYWSSTPGTPYGDDTDKWLSFSFAYGEQWDMNWRSSYRGRCVRSL